jgi:tagatose 1,6-diphosphate aldolase
MVATDQNSSMISMMKKATGREPTYAEIADAKVMLSRALSPHCSGLLVDGYYGYWSTVAAHAVPAGTGLLIRVEKSGAPKNKAGAPCGELEQGWGVGKIKRCGADAVKLLAQFEPGEPDSAEHNFEFTRQIYEACIEHDILFLLEPIHFPYNGETDSSPSKLARKADTVIESAKYLSRYCDIYKAEFPGTFGHETDAQLVDNLKKLNDVCVKPWVLLSAGVDYGDYKKQVEMAMKAGASGILGGRAFWKEFFTYASPAERQTFAERECVWRVKETDAIVQTGTPWFAKYGLTPDDLHGLRAAEGWHARYGGGTAVAAGPGKIDPNAVY